MFQDRDYVFGSRTPEGSQFESVFQLLNESESVRSGATVSYVSDSSGSIACTSVKDHVTRKGFQHVDTRDYRTLGEDSKT